MQIKYSILIENVYFNFFCDNKIKNLFYPNIKAHCNSTMLNEPCSAEYL